MMAQLKAGVSWVMDRDATAQSVNNTGAETTVYTKTITGTMLAAGSTFRLSLWGSYLNNDGATRALTVRVKFQGVTVATFDGFSAITNNATKRGVFLTVLVAVDAANGEGLSHSRLHLSDVGVTGQDSSLTGAANDWGALQANYEDFAVNTGSTADFVVTVQHGTASANITFTMQQAILEQLP